MRTHEACTKMITETRTACRTAIHNSQFITLNTDMTVLIIEDEIMANEQISRRTMDHKIGMIEAFAEKCSYDSC